MPLTIDADAHLIEGIPFAAEALQRWPGKVQVMQTPGGTPYLAMEGRRYPHQDGTGAGCPPQHGIHTSAGDVNAPASVVADADREGIDRMVLFPSLGLGTTGIEDPAFAVDFAGVYNRYVARFCKAGEGRLFGVAALPLQDVAASVQALHDARDLGLVAAVIPPALRDKNLDHPDLDPVYAAAADLGLPLGVHGAPGVHLPKIGVDRFTNYIQVHCISFPFDQMTAMTALISGGVFDRHPKLRVAFLEAGATWLPFFLDRLHEHWEKRGDWIPNGWRRDPRTYLESGNVWVSCEPGETLLPAVVDALGDDYLLYASDYPHWDSEFPDSAKNLRERSDLSPATRAKILGENAGRLFGIS